MIRTILSVGALLSFSVGLFAQTSRTDSVRMYLEAQMSARKIPGMQVAIIRGGKIDLLETYGSASLEHKVAVTTQTLFHINSITKAFVGVAVMQLAEAGKLTVNDPISRYLDSLPESWRGVTIRQLLSHTSGLPDILDEEENVFPGGEHIAWQRLLQLPVVSPSGDKFFYNQAGYVMIGKLINKLSGMHFTRFIEERQFKPAGMLRTRFGDSFDVIENNAGIYTMNNLVGGSFVRMESPGTGYMRFPVFYRTAAGIMSTAGEMAQWLIALKSGKLLNAASLKEMWAPTILNNGRVGGFNSFLNGYALGWPVVSRAEHPAVAPTGGGRNALAVYLKDDLSIIILTNLMGANPEQFLDPIAGYYMNDMHASAGFGLPPSIRKLHVALSKSGYDKIGEIVRQLTENEHIVFNEDEVNAYGYRLMRGGELTKAVAVFKLNTQLNPKSPNVFDSYGEVNEVLGNRAAAIESYRMVIKLDPENKNALERIRVLSKN